MTSLQSKDFQESSLASQFESISSSTFSLLYVLLSHSYMTTGKTIALTIQTFVGKVMSLLFNTLFRFIMSVMRTPGVKLQHYHSFPSKEQVSFNFMPQSLSTVTLKPKKRKSVTASTFPPSICHKVMELDAMILVFFEC